MKIYHLNEITTLNVSVLPTQLMIADNVYLLTMFLVQGNKDYKKINSLSFENLK